MSAVGSITREHVEAWNCSSSVPSLTPASNQPERLRILKVKWHAVYAGPVERGSHLARGRVAIVGDMRGR